MACSLERPEASPPDPQEDVLAYLSDGRAFGRTVPKRIDTHAASIFLAGDRAWKLKRAVRYDYLDFSTPGRRQAALEAELKLNRRTAPTLYRGIHAITRSGCGRLAIDGDGETVDWLLEMRRFGDDDLLEHKAEAGQLEANLLTRLADRVAAFHADSKETTMPAGADPFRRIVEGNRASMAAFPDLIDQQLSRHLAERLLAMIDELAPLLDARAHAGRVRHGHGDLHLANIAMIDGEPTPFDCLEFSTKLATVDLLYDLAFLLMDLWQRGLHVEANIVFNRYLDLSPADETGIALMPPFLATRAAIRAHVLAAKSARSRDTRARAEAARFLDVALDLLTPLPARVVAIGGLSGTGKSTLARAIGGAIGRAPGARVIRSDVLRKRLAGVPPETRLSSEHYSAGHSERVYLALAEGTASAIAGGQSVIADAAFMDPAQRGRMAAVARTAGAGFTGLWLETSLARRVTRLSTRRADASDADAAVARSQAKIDIGDLGDWHRLATADGHDAVAAAAGALLEVRL